MANFYPLLGEHVQNPFAHFQIAEEMRSYTYSDSQELNAGLAKCLHNFKSRFDVEVVPYGGYLEKRDFYKVSGHFTEGLVRNIHLGIDIWKEAGSKIFCPCDALVHSVAYNGAAQDYGWCLIIKTNGMHLLFGHMSEDVSHWNAGDLIKRGDIIGSLGQMHENGGWESHLHFQAILNMEDKMGDYPGVCALKDLEHYAKNCPNPEYIFLNKTSV